MANQLRKYSFQKVKIFLIPYPIRQGNIILISLYEKENYWRRASKR